MSRTQCLLALVAVYVGLAHSWDIAIGVSNQLTFYTDGIETNTVDFISQKFAALAYDEVHNRMLYVDKQSNNDAICGYGISSKENKCFITRTGGSIHSIAFDPITQTLFFTDTNDKSINWISLKSGSANSVKANLLIKIDDGTPTDIAVDSCKGYIYWINRNMTNDDYDACIERAQFNSSRRELIYKEWSAKFDLLSLVIDPLTWKIYYFVKMASPDLDEGWLQHVDLNGQHDDVMYNYYAVNSSPSELTVTKKYLYWVNSTKSFNTVSQLPKYASLNNRKPKTISGKFYTKEPLAIVTNYKIEDQIQGVADCDALSSPIPLTKVNDNSLNIEHKKEYTTDVCNCTPNYIVGRCEVSLCQNYCLHGNCSLNDEGLPTCSCNAGYTGERCEVYICHGYCLNGGECSLNEKDEPVCQCAGTHEGSRCGAVKVVTINNTSTYYSTERNLTLADLLSNWRKTTARVTVTVEV